jgi:hypothetical protein
LIAVFVQGADFWMTIIVFFLTMVIIEIILLLYLSGRLTQTHVAMSPSDYKKMILTAEANASELLFLPKRLSALFKPDSMIRAIAALRHAPGSEFFSSYISEHEARKASFHRALDRGTTVKMIYRKEDLIQYFKQRKHLGVDNDMEISDLKAMIDEWKTLYRLYPGNFFVGLTEVTIAMKYEVIDRSRVVFHESAGSKSRDRLTAICIESKIVAEKVARDFETIWDDIPIEFKSTENVNEWIDTTLLPILTEVETK